MHFAIIGYDGQDAEAPARRLAARQAHLDLFQRLYEAGTFLFGSALLDEAGNMIGSLIVAEFPTLEALHKDWLDTEPYVAGNVWKDITIHPTRLPPGIPSSKA
jgi:uncharacterized protein